VAGSEQQNWKRGFMDMDVGLTKISIAPTESHSRLPTVRTVTPSNAPIENRLVKILDVKALGSEILASLAPTHARDTSFNPHEYQDQLKDTLAQIGRLAHDEKRTAVLTLYREVSELLKGELKDNDLLDEFRVMLLQG
jgi:hypothetical protein